MDNQQPPRSSEEVVPEGKILQAISIRKLDRLETTRSSQGASN
jgi:hypothetical protein